MSDKPDRPPIEFSPRYGTMAAVRNRLLLRDWLIGTRWGRRTGLAVLILIAGWVVYRLF